MTFPSNNGWRNPWRNPVVVPLINKATGNVDFEVTLWGTSYEAALIVPCPAIHALASRYPSHTSSPFLIHRAFED